LTIDPKQISGAPANPPQPEIPDAFLNQREVPGAAPGNGPAKIAPARDTRVQLWAHRTSVFLFVMISAIAGVLLLILPWTPEWTDNYLLLSYPGLRTLVANGFFRGFFSGLGLLDIWIGFWEALHYHEPQ
jgi:hypothetical protein